VLAPLSSSCCPSAHLLQACAGAAAAHPWCDLRANHTHTPTRARAQVKVAEHVVTRHKVAIKILNRRKIQAMDMEEKGERARERALAAQPSAARADCTSCARVGEAHTQAAARAAVQPCPPSPPFPLA
jgi:hypothetical protein